MNNQIRNKLLHYELPPPPSTWKEIESSLDAGSAAPFAARLSDLEINPPTLTWQKLENSLESPRSRVLSLRFTRPLKIATAAAAVLIIAVLLTFMFTRKSESGSLVRVPVSSPTNPEVPSMDSSIPEGGSPDAGVAVLSPKTSDRPKLRTRTIEAGITSSMTPVTLLPRRVEPIQSYAATEPDDKYMVYSDDDGNAIRLPKKLFEVFACSQENIVCRQRIRLLQEKIAAAAYTSNFTGILDLLNELKENQ